MFNISWNDVIEPLSVPLTTGSRTLFSQHKTSSYLCWGSTNWVFVKRVDRANPRAFFFLIPLGGWGRGGDIVWAGLNYLINISFSKRLKLFQYLAHALKLLMIPPFFWRYFRTLLGRLPEWCIHWLSSALCGCAPPSFRSLPSASDVSPLSSSLRKNKTKKKQPCCQWLALSPANRCCSLPLQARDFRRASELVDSVVSTVPCFVGVAWTRCCFLKIYLMSIKKKTST